MSLWKFSNFGIKFRNLSIMLMKMIWWGWIWCCWSRSKWVPRAKQKVNFEHFLDSHLDPLWETLHYLAPTTLVSSTRTKRFFRLSDNVSEQARQLSLKSERDSILDKEKKQCPLVLTIKMVRIPFVKFGKPLQVWQFSRWENRWDNSQVNRWMNDLDYIYMT